MTDEEIRAKWKLWNDRNHEDKSFATISIQGVKFPCVKKYETGTDLDEENYFACRELFRYIVNDVDRMNSILDPLGYQPDERNGAKLGLLNEIARYYHTEAYTYSQIKKDVGSEMLYLDNEARDILRNIGKNVKEA